MLAFSPLSPHLGAEVCGVDLHDALGRESCWVHDVARLLMRYKVLRFRGQVIGPGELTKLASLFGPVRALKRADSGDVTHIPGHPEVKVVSNVTRDGKPIGDGGSSENSWHTDGSYLPRPTALTFLYGRKSPSRRPPRTCFLSLQHIYDRLPQSLIDAIAPLRAIHYSPWSFAPEFADEIRALPAGADRRHIGPLHPLVRRDPASGRLSLFPPRQRACLIEGCSPAESEKLSDVLWSVIETTTEWWGDSIEPDDLLIFDNRYTMHRREAFAADEERILWHVTTDEDRPA